MMNYLILVLLACSGGVALLAQGSPPLLRVEPARIDAMMRVNRVFPEGRTLYPRHQVISLTTPDSRPRAWSATISGALATACAGPCIRLTSEFSFQSALSGTAPQRIALKWVGSNPEVLAVGTYTGTVTFTPVGGASVAMPVTLTVTPPQVTEVTATAQAAVQGCANSNPSVYSYDAACAITAEAPAADAEPPAVGAWVTDPNLGGRIRRITPSGCEVFYGSTTAFSAKSTYIYTSCGIYRREDAALFRPVPLPGHPSKVTLSALDDESYYYLDGAELRKYNWVQQQDQLLASFASYGFTELYGGGTVGTSDDDWLAFHDRDSVQPRLCAVNLPALESAGGILPSNTFCTTDARIPGNIDWVAVSGPDRPSGKRFVYLSGVPQSLVFSIGAPGELRFEYIVPEWPGWPQNNDDGFCTPAERCYNANVFTHNALYVDADGQAKMTAAFEDIWQNRYYTATYRFNAGRELLRPREEGGGVTLLGITTYDRQPGCSSQIGGCVGALFEACCRFAARVTAVTPLPVPVLELSRDHGWVPGNRRLRIENAPPGWACLNGLWTNAEVLTGNQVRIPADCTAAAGGPLENLVLGDAEPSATVPNRGEIQIWRDGQEVRRLAMHRSVPWRDVPGTNISDYGATPRASLSRDGRWVMFNSNWGRLDPLGPAAYLLGTGFDPVMDARIKHITPAADGIAVTYDVPQGTGCELRLSDVPTSFAQPVLTATDPGGTLTRSALLRPTVPFVAGTRYWLRLQCGAQVNTRDLRIPAASSGASRQVLQVGPLRSPRPAATAVLETRLSPQSAWEAQAPTPCEQGCRLSWTAAAGAAGQYRIQYRDTNGDVLWTTPARAWTQR